MNSILADNRQRWNALAEVRVMHTVPFLDFTREDAAQFVYRFPVHGLIAHNACRPGSTRIGGGGERRIRGENGQPPSLLYTFSHYGSVPPIRPGQIPSYFKTPLARRLSIFLF